MNSSILNISFYRFIHLDSLPELRVELRERCVALGLKGTILLAPEGINGFLAGAPEAIRKFCEELRQRPGFEDLGFKESYSNTIPFGRMLVKLKKEIISMGKPEIRPAEWTAPRVLPAELKRWLDENPEVTLLDTRNEYEIAYGTFDKAISMGLDHFRKFPERLEELALREPALKEKPVVMFCTGGIRCEKAGAVAMAQGFKQVYQLEGGILKYFEEVGGDHYRGSCFVFDERVAVDHGLEQVAPPEPELVAKSHPQKHPA